MLHKLNIMIVAILFSSVMALGSALQAQDFQQDQDRDKGDKKVKGQVINADTEEPVFGAEVTISETGQTTTTDQNGEFEFDSVESEMEDQDYTIEVSLDGYEREEKQLNGADMEEDLTIELRQDNGQDDWQQDDVEQQDDWQQDDDFQQDQDDHNDDVY